MGVTNDEEARLSTSDIPETLPLYEESQFHSELELTLPERKATPDEVRDFLVQLLQSRGLGLDHARRVAARWTVGTGQELRAYPVTMYREIFGSEDGWAVCKGVRVMVYKKEDEEKGILRYGAAMLLAVSAILALVCLIVVLVAPGFGVWKGFLMMLGWAAFISTIVCTVQVATVSCDPERRAEQALQSGWNKTPGSQSNSN